MTTIKTTACIDTFTLHAAAVHFERLADGDATDMDHGQAAEIAQDMRAALAGPQIVSPPTTEREALTRGIAVAVAERLHWLSLAELNRATICDLTIRTMRQMLLDEAGPAEAELPPREFAPGCRGNGLEAMEAADAKDEFGPEVDA